MLLVLMRISGGKITDLEDDKSNFTKDNKPKKKLTCRERIAPYIIDPMSPYKIAWDMFMGVCYLYAIVIDPFVYSEHFFPLENKRLNRFNRFLTLIFLVNIIVTPLTGVPREDSILVDTSEESEEQTPNQKKRRGNVS